MAKVILRILFILVCVGIGHTFYPQLPHPDWELFEWGIIGAVMGLIFGLVILGAELVLARRFIQTVPVVMISLIFGFIVANLFLQALFLIPAVREASAELKNALNVIIVLVFTYVSVMMILQTKDEWKFIIPYVEFKRSQKGPSPILLDTSVIIDGRIFDILQTRTIDSHIIIPSFVVRELHAISDSRDRLKRRRGRRGLDVLNAIKDDKSIDSVIHEAHYTGLRGVDEKLIRLAKDLGGRIMTTDFNLNKVASFQDIEVLNINDLANALKPAVLPGEEISLNLVRPGEEHGQAVGYLDDGTMVVVDEAKDKIGATIDIVITSVHQSSAGKMFFGRLKGRNRR